MPTVTITLVGEHRSPVPHQVELNDLTPRARAFAEAIHQCAGHRPLAIVFETGRLMRDTPGFAIRYGTGPEAEAIGDRPEQVTVSNWSPTSHIQGGRRVGTDPVEWLETEIRTIPLDSYPVSAAPFPFGSGESRVERVPSADAGAADRALTRVTILDYLRDHGYPVSDQAWDTLRGTGHLPEPFRYVCGRPQWRPETVDAYIGRDRERWPLSRVAEFLGYGGDPKTAAGSARKQLHRWGITAEGRAPGRGGESLYAADQIQAAHAHRPGRGRRTDLAQRSG